MCILCVVQKWSRRVATMLPWLLFPLLGLWAFSHLLPPGFRFEFTSPRIACVLVLLVTIFWYEVLMPQLSQWRATNSAKCREQKRREAIEMQKLRKIATRLCRNCLTPYRDQNPGGGKFMCSYCGHVSKRPVLDIPGNDVDSKGVRKECCIFGNDNSNRMRSAVRSNCKGKNGGESSGSDDLCFTTKLCMSTSKASIRYFSKFRRFWRSIFGLASEDDSSSDGDNDDMMFREGENGLGFQESKGEKARRKAEEKRQARLEKELLEEEERKQREEVAKLVEEQRRLRDEKMEAEKVYTRSSTPDREKNSKREAERKRQERRKEKDKGSSKSNSDCEDFERKIGKDSDKKRDLDKKSESGRRDLSKTPSASVKARNSETGNVTKVSTPHTPTRGNGTRYLDRMKGSFMSSSKAFNGSGFFGKGANASLSVTSKASNHIGSVDHIQHSSSQREHVALEIRPQPTGKKSWRQLFTRAPAVHPSTESFSGTSNQTFQTAAHSSFISGQASSSHPLADQISFGLPLPFSLSPFPNGSTSSSPISSSVAEPIYSHIGDPPYKFVSEEPDIFEDPCYVPDPVSLLGPVSESLDNFSLDFGGGIMKDATFERPYGLQNLPRVEVSKPSPIEAPVSRLRIVEERHINHTSYPTTPKLPNADSSPLKGSNNGDEEGMWKMWSPLGQDSFGLIGGSGSWLLPLGQNTSSQEDVRASAQKPLAPPFSKDNQVHSGSISPQRLPNGGPYSPSIPGAHGNNPWFQQTIFQPLPGEREENFPPLNVSQGNVTFCDSRNLSSNFSSEMSPSNQWSKTEGGVNGGGGEENNSAAAAGAVRPHIGGLFSTPDVQSLWSYN
ncbi:hypothetical protein ACHQM5_013469 [Ranunculus cassubicifolius]